MYTARYTLPILCRRCGNTLGVPSGKNNKTSKKTRRQEFVRTQVEVATKVEAYGLRLMPGECSRSEYLGSGTIAGS